MRWPSAGPAVWVTYHHSQPPKASATATQPTLQPRASLKVTRWAPPWRISTRSASRARTTRPPKAAHIRGEAMVSIGKGSTGFTGTGPERVERTHLRPGRAKVLLAAAWAAAGPEPRLVVTIRTLGATPL